MSMCAPSAKNWKAYVGEFTFNCANANELWAYVCSETPEGNPPGQQVEVLLKPERGRLLPCHQLFSILWAL